MNASDRSLSFHQVSAIVRGNLLRVAALALAFLAMIAAVTFLLPKQYTSTAALVVDTRSKDLVDGSAAVGVAGTVYLSTQAEIIRSERVAQGVIANLKLADDETQREDWLEETRGDGDYEAWLANKLGKRLAVNPAKDSSVITIGFTSNDAEQSAAIANAYLDGYLRVVSEMRSEPARNYSAFFEEQTRDAREQLEKAQRALSDHEQRKGILVSDARLDIETLRLNDLSSEYVRMQEMSVESRSRRDEARQRPETTVDALRDPLVASLRSEIAQKESELQQLGQRLGSQHPTVIERDTHLAGLRSRLNDQLRRVAASAGSTENVTSMRLAELRRSLEEQRSRVAQLKVSRDVANVLQRDIEHAQRNYEAVMSRYSATRLERDATQTPVSVIRRATVPGLPSSPRVLLNLALGAIVSAMLAAGVVVARELRNRRLRIAEDVTRYLRLPLLSTLPSVHIGSSTAGPQGLRLKRQILQTSFGQPR